MKRILILGANQETIPLVKQAIAERIEVHVADPNLYAPAKEFASTAVNIDATDLYKLRKYVSENKIDGVLVGVADRLIETYAKLCELAELPSYCNVDVAMTWTNKSRFNDLFASENLPTIPSLLDTSIDYSKADSIVLPALVKPTDSSAGKGIRVVQKFDNLKSAIQNAKLHSVEGRALIEKYMEGDDLIVYISLLSGEARIIATADRYTISLGSDHSKVCIGANYPSKYQSKIVNTFETRISNACIRSGLSSGLLLIGAFVEDERFFFYDPGLRLQGEAPDVHVLNESGVSHTSSLINLALGNDYKNKHQKSDRLIYQDGSTGHTIWLLIQPGVIKNIFGINKLLKCKNIFDFRQRFHVGDRINKELVGTEGQVFARIYVKSQNSSDLIEVINLIKNHIKVSDRKGNSMLVDVPYEKLLL